MTDRSTNRLTSKPLDALGHLQEVALAGGNIFEVLMDTVRVCSMGEIMQALFQVGGNTGAVLDNHRRLR